MNTPSRNCAECGAKLADDAVAGLCPRCLLQAGMASETDPNATVVDTGGRGPQRVLPNAGETFGPYRIVRLLGRGGMGVVYEAEEQDTGRRVALKILGRQFDSPKDRARFLREGRLAASINHPNSVYVFGTDEINGSPTI
ncbi:MAG TPA: serine/threonine protein kinase, partial [Planctomycetaceae bacterium]|nr:serine/threonine protein kinase [Planctomycetaceae bacterium]